jgi:hypothetical protein
MLDAKGQGELPRFCEKVEIVTEVVSNRSRIDAS